MIMSRLQITTNEWIDATKQKPWAMRLVLVRHSDDTKGIAYWNGTVWLTQGGSPYRGDITHFYVFERYIPHEDEAERLP